jgi:hypothetical protein
MSNPLKIKRKRTIIRHVAYLNWVSCTIINSFFFSVQPIFILTLNWIQFKFTTLDFIVGLNYQIIWTTLYNLLFTLGFSFCAKNKSYKFFCCTKAKNTRFEKEKKKLRSAKYIYIYKYIYRGGTKGVAGIGYGHPRKLRNYYNILDIYIKLNL